MITDSVNSTTIAARRRRELPYDCGAPDHLSEADIPAAKAIKADVATVYAGYGVK
jgi:hypothetical protein